MGRDKRQSCSVVQLSETNQTKQGTMKKMNQQSKMAHTQTV